MVQSLYWGVHRATHFGEATEKHSLQFCNSMRQLDRSRNTELTQRKWQLDKVLEMCVIRESVCRKRGIKIRKTRGGSTEEEESFHLYP